MLFNLMLHNNITMKYALRELGVDEQTLSLIEKQTLARDGYLVIPNVLTRDEADRLVLRLEELAAAEGENAGKDFQVEPGATRLGSLINKDPLFDICFLHPRALAGVAEVMGDDFGLSSITARAAQPGQGAQVLHVDSQAGVSANVLWVVSDFTAENGPTRLVPGSHLSGTDPRVVLADPSASHPEEVLLIAPAGTMVIINGALWHGGTTNNSSLPRHLVSAFWTPRGGYQSDSYRVLTKEVVERLSVAAQFVVDHEVEALGRAGVPPA